MRLGVVGNHLSQCSLPGAGRTEEDERGEQSIGFDGAPQQRAGGDDVLLPDELIQRAWAHARRQGHLLADEVLRSMFEEIHALIILFRPW